MNNTPYGGNMFDWKEKKIFQCKKKAANEIIRREYFFLERLFQSELHSQSHDNIDGNIILGARFEDPLFGSFNRSVITE